jgi:hypothetical protein
MRAVANRRQFREHLQRLFGGGERRAQLVGQLYGCLGLPQAVTDEQVGEHLVEGAQQFRSLVHQSGGGSEA